jgi:hypothetical protein
VKRARKDWGRNHVTEICGRRGLEYGVTKILEKVRGAVGRDFFDSKPKIGFGYVLVTFWSALNSNMTLFVVIGFVLNGFSVIVLTY